MKTKCSERTNVLWLTMAAVGLILALWPAVGQSQRSRRQNAVDPNAAPQPNSWASFEIILTRNIFSPTRRAAVRFTPGQDQATPPAPDPETYFVLKGVVQQNDDFIAFIEDTQTGTVQKLRRGDPVARGAIKTLTLDGLEYQMGDKTVIVQVGRNLEGQYGAATTRRAPVAPASSPAAATTDTAPAASPPSGGEADILKRLMEQRKQQLGQ